jgi:hypothetical protein
MRYLLVCIVLVLIAAPAATALAQGPATVLIGDDFCGLFDATGNFFATTNMVRVFANDANGNSMIACHAPQPDHVPNPAKSVVFTYENTGIPCSTGFGSDLTLQWRGIVTPDGMAHLFCFINPGAELFVPDPGED